MLPQNLQLAQFSVMSHPQILNIVAQLGSSCQSLPRQLGRPNTLQSLKVKVSGEELLGGVYGWRCLGAPFKRLQIRSQIVESLLCICS